MSTRNYHSDCHRKYILQAHVILSCKYRKKLLIKLGDIVKQIIMNVADTHGFKICTMEVDKDHLHILIDYSPSWALKDLISLIKQMTTYHIWHSYDYEKFLKNHFWKEKTLWTDGYFVCSVGDANEQTIRHYIESQG
jgi:putative transposase